MSTPTITPDQQATSTLGAMAGGSDPTQNYPASPDQGGPVPTPSQASAPDAQPKSRLQSILGAVANVVSTGLQGIPDKGRPSFITGLGEGARSAQALKFKSFDDQFRLAQLHNQDLKLQNDTEAQRDAHVRAELDNRALANSLGIDYDTIPSNGQAVMDHLTAQTAMNGAASVPPGTHLSGDGETVNIPKDTQATRDGQKQMYQMLAPVYGLPSLPPGAQFVPPVNMNMLTNKLHGYDQAGKPIEHQNLPGAIGALKVQRDQLAQNGASPEQLKAIDNTLGIYQANLDALDKHDADIKAKNKQAELDVENSPENIAAAGKKAAQVEQAKLNVTNSPANQAAAARGAAAKSAAEQAAKGTGELNAVAYDPNYQNPDGTKGANVVMNKEEAQAKGLSHYKADANKINTVVAGMNDVQNKLNQLADITTDPKRMTAVQGPTAATLLKNGFGLEIGAFHTKVDVSNINTAAYEAQLKWANQATRDYVTAMVGAHEAVTQLPRLQTFGQSNRMTEKQMEAAQNLLPQPGDDAGMAAQKMTSLQTMLDPLRKQIPHMPGAESMPSWLEKRQQQQRQTGGSNLGRAVSMGNPTDLINRLVPSN